ncbi:hypothetical protein NSE01_05540 [Novosphingobium sediminis]|uniref:DUF1656 domain-containing protein n=1 Tax=Novosphingobium sediminis TaxID=707214 RepID=A0A512AGA2_9SPHN|nr:DUF1656 domain-containing protein [Novosphingobium sediminis]GEN98721.1 hypothetical protein NSE01_05540 [Novosphingobium sediminis]
MIEEIQLLGVYVPAALVWAVVAAVAVYLLRVPLQRIPAEKLVWHPGLLDLLLFVLIWWGLGALADTYLTSWLAS